MYQWLSQHWRLLGLFSLIHYILQSIFNTWSVPFSLTFSSKTEQKSFSNNYSNVYTTNLLFHHHAFLHYFANNSSCINNTKLHLSLICRNVYNVYDNYGKDPPTNSTLFQAKINRKNVYITFKSSSDLNNQIC